MAQNSGRKLFLNLAVEKLDRSIAFFRELGFEFNPAFTDENAGCMVVSSENYVMLLQKPYFATFTRKEICDTSKHTEALVGLSCDSREEVDEMVNKALAAGGSKAMDPQDHGFMYGWSFYDPDGHHWEVFWMDPAAVPGG